MPFYTTPRADGYPETYAPKLLRNRLGTSIGASHANVYQTEIQLRLRCRDLLSSVLIRPVTLFSEPIISFSCTFLALEYGIYYLFFQAYPIIFDGTLPSREKETARELSLRAKISTN